MSSFGFEFGIMEMFNLKMRNHVTSKEYLKLENQNGKNGCGEEGEKMVWKMVTCAWSAVGSCVLRVSFLIRKNFIKKERS